jgi:hypothetical protein
MGQDATGREQELPPDFTKDGCSMSSDCNDGNPCTTDRCNQNYQCAYDPVDCSELDDECNAGACNSRDGKCGKVPANEGKTCMTAGQEPGTCMAGLCAPVPQCAVDSFWALDCSDGAQTGDTSAATNILSSYGSITGLDGPELAYEWLSYTERNVTVTLSNATADFDLIILEGDKCVATANVVASKQTPGNGNESLTFKAKADQGYMIVVDAKAGQAGTFTLTTSCEKMCSPVKTLACNQTLMGNTTSGQTKVGQTQCSTTMGGGPEESYLISFAVDTDVKLTLKGLSQDLDLAVVYESGKDCDGYCKAEDGKTGTTDETVSFTAYGTSNYYAIVDSKGAGGPYQLEVSCPPSCASGKTFACDNPEVSGKNDEMGSTDAIDSWTGAPNTTGPEVAYRFDPAVTGAYTITMTGLTADLDLIVVEGTYSKCDPTVTPVATSAKTGTQSETITFNFDSTKYYWIIVDGKNGAVSNFNLKMTSTVAQCVVSCSNPLNSFWGCGTMPYDKTKMGKTDDSGSTDRVSAWCNGTITNLSGHEMAHKFYPDPGKGGMFTFTLSGLTSDAVLMVFEAQTSGPECNPTVACLATSDNPGTANEVVTFNAVDTKDYYVVVDTKNNTTTSYKLEMTGKPAVCPP